MYNFDWVIFWKYLWPGTALQDPLIRTGLMVTISVSIIAQLIGVIMGLFVALGKMSKIAPLRWLAEMYIWYFRGTPLLVQMMLLFFGLGVNAPFGLVTEYDGSWLGRYQAVKSEVKTINVNPAFSFKPTDNVAIGFGVNWQRIEAEFTNKVNYSGALLQAAALNGIAPGSPTYNAIAASANAVHMSHILITEDPGVVRNDVTSQIIQQGVSQPDGKALQVEKTAGLLQIERDSPGLWYLVSDGRSVVEYAPELRPGRARMRRATPTLRRRSSAGRTIRRVLP